LTPGGLLILETPNPDNLSVGSSSFYLDPTHHRPLPSTLLRFLTDHAGFGRSKILYLQESPDLHGPQPIALINVLTGVSPDYAVIAQKSADSHLMGVLDDAFQLDFGLKLDTLASRYDQQRDAHAAKQDAHAAKLENSLTHISAQLISLAKGAELQAEQLGQTTTQLTAVDVALHNLLSSRSWRITAPLRWLSVLAHRAWLRLVNSIKGRS
jgi:O-antigen chain-terminating methyltransferase